MRNIPDKIMKKVERPQERPKVSVVVPIYNVEKYLKECVDSILGQTLKELEVILVDDGSPDNCGKMIDAYAAADARVKVIHQANSGYSTAVNRGIALARGEYIGIIESDDWIEPDMYEVLYRHAKNLNTDVTKGLFYFYNPTLDERNQNIVYKNPMGVDLRYAPSGVFTVTDWPKILAFHASIWSSLYRAAFIKKIKLRDTAGASYQDFPFMIEVMLKAKRISVVKKPFVHWRNEPKQKNSTSANGQKLLLMVKNTEAGLKMIKADPRYNKLKEAFFAHALWANIAFFYRIDRRYKREYYEILQRIFQNVLDDPDFQYLYFTPVDKITVKSLLRHNYYWFYLRRFAGGVKHRLMRLMTYLLPTYRTATYIKETQAEQNMVIAEMKTELEQLLDLLEEKRR